MDVRDTSRGGDGIDRRGMLRCMAWVGTGLVWSLRGGLTNSRVLGAEPTTGTTGELSFVQISDSHIGFSRDPNHDVTATLQAAVDRINALPSRPAFVLHTGDLTHLAKPGEFDTVAEVLKGIKTQRVFCVPGEHDFDGDGNRLYRERFGRGTAGTGWHSFDVGGVHFVGLVNVSDPKSGGDGGLGVIGAEQLDWMKRDLAGLADSTPVVVFAHVPLWAVYEKWGWGTRDAEQALTLLRRFGSLTVLNGHIHQVLRKVEGKAFFHTARSTAFPQNGPGQEPRGPIRDVPADKLRGLLGLSTVSLVTNDAPLAVADRTLE